MRRGWAMKILGQNILADPDQGRKKLISLQVQVED